jgi:UDP-N-acetylmuramoyl-L-alanyl-D-glutamate--2,6-diaminopimelate ligase
LKTLDNILSAINVLQIVGNTQQEIVGLAMHANEVKDNYLFIAQEGTLTDGHAFIPDAIKNGAKAIICSKSLLPMQDGIAYIIVQNTKIVAGSIAAAFYDYPSRQLKIVGITGTNGKTTCATLAYQLFSNLGFTCGLLSTVQNQIAKEILPSTHTTPNPIQLQNLLRKMVDADCSYVFMEVSSHAIHPAPY